MAASSPAPSAGPQEAEEMADDRDGVPGGPHERQRRRRFEVLIPDPDEDGTYYKLT